MELLQVQDLNLVAGLVDFTCLPLVGADWTQQACISLLASHAPWIKFVVYPKPLNSPPIGHTQPKFSP